MIGWVLSTDCTTLTPCSGPLAECRFCGYGLAHAVHRRALLYHPDSSRQRRGEKRPVEPATNSFPSMGCRSSAKIFPKSSTSCLSWPRSVRNLKLQLRGTDGKERQVQVSGKRPGGSKGY